MPAVIRCLVIVPDGSLRRLPFSALCARGDGPPLIARVLGAGSLLLEGAGASEAALKQTDLRRYRILYCATHVVIDERNPDRSAVPLAPSPPSEDGLLQSRDITGLRLNGQVVVLFGCRSVTGTQIRGEGVMGIARAFLQAGARTVVGSLWPFRDAEARGLSEGFCEHPAMGHDVAAALAAAQRERMSAGAPVAAWAGLVVIGDGSAGLVPGGGARSGRRSLVPLIAIVAIIASIASLARARMGLWDRRKRFDT